MLATLDEIFKTNLIEINGNGEKVKVHSNTSLEQGLFIQQVFDKVKPANSLEVGLAYGISSLFILEKHREYHSEEKAHLVIEPFPWGDAPMHNIKKENLERYIEVRNDLSDLVIPTLYKEGRRIQFAYVDTTKVFDVVLQDFYFIDKILDIGGVIIIDDCDTPGINKVARFISSLPHYEVFDKTGKSKKGRKFSFAERIVEFLLKLIPFKKKIMPGFSFKTKRQLDLDYRCIAFRKLDNDKRNWDWDAAL